MIGNRHTTARKWCEGKVRPVQGNAPHDRTGKPGEILTSKSICDDPFVTTVGGSSRMRRLTCVFQAWRNLSGPMGFQNQHQNQILVRDQPPPAGRPRAQAKERAGRITLLLIVRR